MQGKVLTIMIFKSALLDINVRVYASATKITTAPKSSRDFCRRLC